MSLTNEEILIIYIIYIYDNLFLNSLYSEKVFILKFWDKNFSFKNKLYKLFDKKIQIRKYYFFLILLWQELTGFRWYFIKI